VITIITGKPGLGKTASQTGFLLQHYKNDNALVLKLLYRLKYHSKRPIVNLCYSNYPILLDKKNNIWSHCGSLKDMVLKWKYPQGSHMVIDEPQIMYDSDAYKDFPKAIAHFFQTHRHLGIKHLYTNTQSLARLMKKLRSLAEYYYDNIKYIDKIPIIGIPLPWVFVKCIVSFDENSADAPRQESNYVANTEWHIFNKKRLYNAYDDKYLSALQDDAKKYPERYWSNYHMTHEEIIRYFMISNDEKAELDLIEY